jgi:hypothetical protein
MQLLRSLNGHGPDRAFLGGKAVIVVKGEWVLE